VTEVGFEFENCICTRKNSPVWVDCVRDNCDGYPQNLSLRSHTSCRLLETTESSGHLRTFVFSQIVCSIAFVMISLCVC
jgi:hypothetical protein